MVYNPKKLVIAEALAVALGVIVFVLTTTDLVIGLRDRSLDEQATAKHAAHAQLSDCKATVSVEFFPKIDK